MFENDGHCVCCDQNVKFVEMGSPWREKYVCSSCGSITRERAIMYCIDRYFPEWRALSIHESSPIPRGASVRLQKEAPNYIASQWFPDVPTGGVRGGARCENLEALSFPDNSLDLHVTQDVLEHIFEPATAFREIARTLKPGGAHVFTTPIVNKHSPSAVCARRRPDGEIDHLVMPPEYHGNPLSVHGALVTMRWGYDITRIIFEASGLYTDTIIVDSLDLGLRSEFPEVLVSRKRIPASGAG